MAVERALRDAAWNAAAVASLALRQEIVTCARVLGWCEQHGLTMADLCSATGLDGAYIARLRAEAGDL